MKKTTVKFQIIKEKGQWPICIAKTKFRTYICLEYLPYEQNYVSYCREFISRWLYGLAIPDDWQEIENKTYMDRFFDMKKAKKIAQPSTLDELPH